MKGKNLIKKRILFIDDEPSIRTSLRLTLQSDFECLEADNLASALKTIDENEVDTILLDLRLGKESGLDVLKFLNENGLSRPVICISGEASYSEAIDAYRLGAVDFLDKPLTQQKLLLAIKKSLANHEAKERQRVFTQHYGPASQTYIGNSVTVQNLRDEIKAIAPSESKVLILGETGTGKEVVASMIHRQSTRAKEPFVTVDCGALPSTILDSILFGHKKGAFTGADQDQAGRIECADGGTLFLDEIGELTLEGQNRLLRFIETGEFQRVGSTKIQRLNVRIITATSRDMDKLIKESKFRPDLFFRLTVFTLRTPALREITEDIPDIFAFHLNRLSIRNSGERPTINSTQAEILKKYTWPGNVRELRNIAERAAILGVGKAIDSIRQTSSAIETRQTGQEFTTLKEYRHAIERDYISRVLASVEGNVTKAARILGIDRVSLHHKISIYGLKS